MPFLSGRYPKKIQSSQEGKTAKELFFIVKGPVRLYSAFHSLSFNYFYAYKHKNYILFHIFIPVTLKNDDT